MAPKASTPKERDQTPRLLIVRHGETAYNAKHWVRGWHDIPLNKQGLEEAQVTAARLQDEPIRALYSSDLIRAKVTAEAIAERNRNHPPVTYTRELRPWHLGDWEGRPIKTTLKRRLELIERDRDDAPKGGESFHQFAHRFIPFLTQMFEKAEKDRATYGLVCHTHNQRLAISWTIPPFGELTLKPLIEEQELPPGGVVTLEFRRGHWVVADETQKVSGENAKDRQLAEPPDGADIDAILAWWLQQQAQDLGALYASGFDAGAQAFADQFPDLTVGSLSVDDAFQAQAMAAHATSAGKLYGELQSLVGTGGGNVIALDQWFADNASRLDRTAEGLAWTAEQHGYQSAGEGKGLEIWWELDPSSQHCGDCPDLADGSPYTDDTGSNPLPTVPGAAVACGASCNCSLTYS